MKFPISAIFLLTTALFLSVAIQGYGQEENRYSQSSNRSAAFHFRVGEVQLEKHNWTSALASFDECLRLDPSYTDAYYSRAMVYDYLDSADRALTNYNIYLEFRPDHYEALFARAQLRSKAGQYEMARTDLVKLLTIRPGETTAIFFRQNAQGSVDKMFTSNNPDRAYIYNSIGLVDLKREDFTNAIYYFDSAVALSPADPDLFVNRGIARAHLKDTASAISDYQRAIRLDPQNAIAKHNISLLGKGKDLLSKRVLLDEAISDNAKMPFAFAQRAWYFFESGDYQHALADYNKAIELDPNDVEYFLNRGLVKEKLKDNRGAYADYTSAIALQKDYEKAWLNRGNVLAKIGKLKEAVEDYTVAITYSPGYASAFFNRSMVLNRMNLGNEACADLKIAEKLGFKVDPKAWKAVCGN